MTELDEIKKDIAKTKAKLKKAEEDGENEAMLISLLTEQQKTFNLLLAGSDMGNFRSYPRQGIIKSRIAVMNWMDVAQAVTIHNLHADMPWNEFSEEMSLKLGPRFFKLYLLYDDQSKEHVRITDDNFSGILKMSIAARESISKPSSFRIVYFYPPLNRTHVSPTAKPQDLGVVGRWEKEEDRESHHSRDSTIQKLLHAAAAARDDEKCVVCDEDSNLDAAHCFDLNRVKKYTDFASLGIIQCNVVNNVLTMCKQCHKAYDHNMLCIKPDDDSVVICDIFLACSPHKAEFAPLHGKAVRKPVEAHKLHQWPPKAVFEDRYKHFCEQVELRRKKNREYPHYCLSCNMRWKTTAGKEKHACQSRNTKAAQYKIKNYETLKKSSEGLPDLRSLAIDLNSADPEEIDSELSYSCDSVEDTYNHHQHHYHTHYDHHHH